MQSLAKRYWEVVTAILLIVGIVVLLLPRPSKSEESKPIGAEILICDTAEQMAEVVRRIDAGVAKGVDGAEAEVAAVADVNALNAPTSCAAAPLVFVVGPQVGEAVSLHDGREVGIHEVTVVGHITPMGPVPLQAPVKQYAPFIVIGVLKRNAAYVPIPPHARKVSRRSQTDSFCEHVRRQVRGMSREELDRARAWARANYSATTLSRAEKCLSR